MFGFDWGMKRFLRFCDQDPSEIEDWTKTAGIQEGTTEIYRSSKFFVNCQREGYSVYVREIEVDEGGPLNSLSVNRIPNVELHPDVRVEMLRRLFKHLTYRDLNKSKCQRVLSRIEGSAEVIITDSFFRMR